MARTSSAAVVWLPEQAAYALRAGQTADETIRDESARWFEWLDARRSFSFHGAAGQISLLKETRLGSRAAYWYAYRRHGTRTRKQYAGRTADLAFARLEAIAAALNQPAPTARTDLAGQPINTATSPGTPLLAPKLQIPRLPPALISRARLFEMLDAGLRQTLTLLCAPPGYGKTTLVRQWLAKWRIENEELRNEGSAPPSQFSILNSLSNIAWVALDAGDNDPIRFWRYLISACEPLLADRGAAALELLDLPPQPAYDPSPLEPALTALLNALTHTARPGLLVLDDYHVIAAPRIHATLAFFLEHLPPTLHVIITSRREPPLPLARLRVRGELSEIGPAELRFTDGEMAAFLESVGLPQLPATTLRRLGEQLEGWPAGLRLLALALRGSSTPGAIGATLAGFAGSQRPIMEYFVGEVLHAQPATVQDFLLRTSMLRQLSAELCDCVVGASGSAALLADLQRANLFLEPIDGAGRWYRYHALFAEAMQAEARHRLGAEPVRQLSIRASDWYEQHGMRAEAIETALHAEDTDRAADLLARIAISMHLGLDNVQINTHSEFHTLRRWLEQIPDPALDRRPVLLVSYATALLFVALVDQAPLSAAAIAQIEELLGRAESAFRNTGDSYRLGELFAFRAMITRQRGALDEAVRWGRQALALLPAGELSWRSIALGAVGLGELAEGQFGAAEAAFHEAYALCAQIGNRWWTRANTAMLSYVLLERGALHQAAARFEHLLAEARDQADDDDVARAQICLGQIGYEWNNLDAAHHAASEALALGEQLVSDEIWAQAALVMARVQHAQGQAAAARQRLALVLARLHADRSELAERLAREVRLIEAKILLAAGDTAAMQRWAQQLDAEPGSGAALLREREARVAAHLAIVQGDADRAMTVLVPMLAAARAGGRTRCTIETLVLMGLAQAALGRPGAAAERVRAALLEARAEEYRRLFLDHGQPLQVLLAGLLSAEREPALRRYIAELRRAGGAAGIPASAESPDSFAEQLSPHERRVLRLLAAGQTNPEIARELIVSVNTVRSQVQSIYRKLGVHNRVAACELARRMGLLSER